MNKNSLHTLVLVPTLLLLGACSSMTAERQAFTDGAPLLGAEEVLSIRVDVKPLEPAAQEQVLVALADRNRRDY